MRNDIEMKNTVSSPAPDISDIILFAFVTAISFKNKNLAKRMFENLPKTGPLIMGGAMTGKITWATYNYYDSKQKISNYYSNFPNDKNRFQAELFAAASYFSAVIGLPLSGKDLITDIIKDKSIGIVHNICRDTYKGSFNLSRMYQTIRSTSYLPQPNSSGIFPIYLSPVTHPHQQVLRRMEFKQQLALHQQQLALLQQTSRSAPKFYPIGDLPKLTQSNQNKKMTSQSTYQYLTQHYLAPKVPPK